MHTYSGKLFKSQTKKKTTSQNILNALVFWAISVMIEMEYTQTAVTTHRKEQAFRENVIL